MLKALLITFIVGAIVFLLSGFSIHSHSLRQEVKRLLRTDFNDELVLIKAQTEHKAGTPVPSGRQRMWIYDQRHNHYLFFNFVDSAFVEYREPVLGGNRTHQRDSRETIKQKIKQQRDELITRASLLHQFHNSLEADIQQPFFVHFGHTDRYRYTTVDASNFHQHHPVYLNIALPDELSSLLSALNDLLPTLKRHFTAHPHSKVTFYPGSVHHYLQSFFDAGYWVSGAPPDQIVGSRPEEELWHYHSRYLSGQSAVSPAPASEQEARYTQVTMSSNLQRLLRHQTRVNQLASSHSTALSLSNVADNASSALSQSLHARIDNALSAQGIALPQRRVLYYLDKEGEHWVIRFYATEQGFTKPLYIVYNLATDHIEATRLPEPE